MGRSRLPNREAGLITTTDTLTGRVLSEVSTVQCVHCGLHIRRDMLMYAGFCQNCNGFHCGDGCEACVPTEQMLENIEAGRDPSFRPIRSGPRSFGGPGNSTIFTGE
jgi:hypothetical protein